MQPAIPQMGDRAPGAKKPGMSLARLDVRRGGVQMSNSCPEQKIHLLDGELIADDQHFL
jgi:hypothetical protein